jgi:hypothetical protein
MITQLKVIGILLIALALLHIAFPKYFKWEEELGTLSLINRQLMTVHTFFIGLTVFLIGLLCLTSSNDLIHTNLGKKVCIGLGIFWTLRLFTQFFGYSSKLWRGKRFETVMHILFVFIWGYLSFFFWSIAIR